MDSRKRKRNQGRIRMRKHRAIAKMFQQLESNNPHDESSVDCLEDENLPGPSTLSEHNEELEESEEPDELEESDEPEELEESDEPEELEESDEPEELEESDEPEELEESDEPDEFEDNVEILDEEFEIEPEEDPEIQQLRKWAVERKICHSYLDELLEILRHRLLPTLPKSAKTFLKTVDSKYRIVEMEDANGDSGEFVYFGVENELKRIINPDLHIENNSIELQVNVDTVPLTKSGSQQFTPILCKIHNIPDIYEVFTVAIYYGRAKPKNTADFLRDFITEINKLHADGIVVSNTHFNIQIKCFICDTPARAWLRNSLGHGGLCPCERCVIRGERCNNRTVYPSVNSAARTDESFRNQSQREHHHPGPSPLTEIEPPLNMGSVFVLDFMHLCCIGVMKKLLEYWLSSNLNCRLDRRSRIELSRRMGYLKAQVPSEFQRKPRPTNCVAKWKATEFRFFLLYGGPIVLKGILRDVLYNHFLLFSSACRILCSDALCIQYREHAKHYLRSFFISLKDLYGPHSQIMNCHNLIHIADDVEYMGCSLNHITAFPFESMLGKMKSSLRTAHRPLAQLCRRVCENRLITKNKATIPPRLEIFGENENDVKKIRFKSYNITTSTPDNIVILNDGTIVMITKIFGNLANLQFNGKIWQIKRDVFTYPTNSADLKIWELQKQVTRATVTYSVDDIASKLVKLSISFRENNSEKNFGVSLIH